MKSIYKMDNRQNQGLNIKNDWYLSMLLHLIHLSPKYWLLVHPVETYFQYIFCSIKLCRCENVP